MLQYGKCEKETAVGMNKQVNNHIFLQMHKITLHWRIKSLKKHLCWKKSVFYMKASHTSACLWVL